MKEQWRKDIRQKLADYQKPAPVLSWADIEQVAAVQRSGAEMFPLRRKWVAVAAVVLLAVGGFYLAFQQKEGMTGLQERQIVKAQETVREESHTSSDVSSEVLIPQKTSEVILLAEEVKPVMEKGESGYKEVGTEVDTIVKGTSQEPALQTMSPAHIGNDGYQGVKTVMPRENRLTAKVYLSNTIAGNTGSSSVRGTYVNSMPSSDPINGGSTIPQSTSYHEEIHHRQPVRLGVSLHYRLNDRWGIESGLSYTRLLSDITCKYATQTIHIEQKLSYIGIPVNVTCHLWNNRRFSCYLSAGVMAEKMITGSRTSEGKEEGIKNQPLQFSINGAAGNEYQLGNVLGFFVEPGLSYHFKNSGDIPTFYQEKPLGFNLNLGIRFYLNRHNTVR